MLRKKLPTGSLRTKNVNYALSASCNHVIFEAELQNAITLTRLRISLMKEKASNITKICQLGATANQTTVSSICTGNTGEITFSAISPHILTLKAIYN